MLSKETGRAGHISQLIHKERVWFPGMRLEHRPNAGLLLTSAKPFPPSLSYQTIALLAIPECYCSG